VKISIIQSDIVFGQPEKNIQRTVEKLQQAMKDRPDVIVLPELWSTGYDLTRIHEIGDREGQEIQKLFSSFALEHGVNLVLGSVAEVRDEGVYNTSYVFNREGTVTCSYSKVHLFRLMEEEKYLAPGVQNGRFALDGVSAAVMICYDIRFPEFTRKLALGGTKILFVPAEWPHPRLHHWRTLLMARAIENQMFVVACNRVGHGAGTDFFGHSMVINPWGEVIVEGDEGEAILTAEVRIEEVDEVRKKIPIFEDRRPDFY
jgi:omega-amidase